MRETNRQNEAKVGAGSPFGKEAYRLDQGGTDTGRVSSAGPQVYSPLQAAAQLLEADKAHRSLAADQVLMMRMVMPMLGQGMRTLQQGINNWMRHQGFWSKGLLTVEQARWEKSEKIALIHSEVSELLEGVREGKGRENEGEECADIVIRVMDYCEQYGIDLADFIERKMYKNYQRPFKHGKAF